MAKKATDFKTAKIYAQAFYESARTVGVLPDVIKDIEILQSVEPTKIKEFSYFSNPTVELSVKNEIITAVSQELNLCPQTLNLLKILIENGKFKILGSILKDVVSLYNKDANIAEITVETVQKLNKTQDNLLKKKLSELFKKEIKINYVISPEILGGLVIKNGTILIDLSLKNQLKKIEQLMKGTD